MRYLLSSCYNMGMDFKSQKPSEFTKETSGDLRFVIVEETRVLRESFYIQILRNK